LWAILALLVFEQASAAHPPKAISLAWNPNGSLTVNVDHSVNDPQKHYINKIIVYANDKVVAQKDYSSQTSADGLTDVFNLGTQPGGTTIKVEAYCVIMGSVAASITVP
jgi:desulfoferrodoxin (superoxide reductase-like protein)